VTGVDRTDPVLSRASAWHQSTLETLLDGCSWQYFLTYVAQAEAAPKASSTAGIAYHLAIEMHERARQDGAEEGLPLKEMLAIAEKEVRDTMDEKDVVDAAKAALRNWYAKPMKDGELPHREWLMQHEPVAIEPYFRTPLVEGAKPIAGWIDGVYRNTDSKKLMLIDHKTAKSLSRWGYDGNEHRHQATLYSVALALTEDLDYMPDMTYLISRTSAGRGASFEPARRVTVQPDLLDVAELGDRVRKAEQMVADQEFVRRPEWVLCDERWCPFYERCMGTGELAGTVEQVWEKVKREGGSVSV
jgi:hypothetical protein